jgi:hypothetical protein
VLVFSDNFAKFARQKWQTGFGVASGEFKKRKLLLMTSKNGSPRGRCMASNPFFSLGERAENKTIL